LQRERQSIENDTLLAEPEPDIARIADVLSQRLTAASNYMGTARRLLQSTRADASARAVENLQHAETQIESAGAIFRRLREGLD
jgi:phosphoglycerate-specific signal transduction histidine kinase